MLTEFVQKGNIMADKNIALYIGGLQFDSQRKFVEGVWDKIIEDDNKLFLFANDATSGEIDSADKFNEGEFKIYSLPKTEDFDGVIFYSATIYDDSVRENIIGSIDAAKVDCISINVKYPGLLYVEDDNWDVMQELIDGIFSKRQIKKVNIVCGERFSRDNSKRCASVQDALARRSINVPAERIYYGDFSANSGRKAVVYFKDNNLLDADLYVCMNDQMALGAYYELKNLGIQVPEEAMITGFDHIFIARNHTPSITTVDRDEKLLGKRSYEILMNAIEGDEHIHNEQLPCHVRWGGTTDSVDDIGDKASDALNHYARMKIRTDRYAMMINSIAAKMCSVGNLHEYVELLKSSIQNLECDEFYLCLNEESGINLLSEIEDGFGYVNSGRINTEYEENLKVELGYCNGEFFSGQMVKKGDIIPGGMNQAKKGAVYVVCPIHYLERCYGYVAICNSRLPMENNYFHMFIMTLTNGLEQIRESVQLNNMIKHLDDIWTYDALTHIYNRSGFLKYADEYVTKAKYDNKQLLVIFLDLDHLKVINDELGHDQGDLMIKATADILKKCKSEDELLMRYGGDEFVLLGSGYDNEGAKAYVQRIHDGMQAYNTQFKPEIPLESSIGYCLVECDIDEPLSALIKIADQEMYDIKKEKRRARLMN